MIKLNPYWYLIKEKNWFLDKKNGFFKSNFMIVSSEPWFTGYILNKKCINNDIEKCKKCYYWNCTRREKK